MKVALVFEPDHSLGFDPRDSHQTPRRLGEFIDAEKTDVLLIWREYGDDFEDGYATHVVSAGIWEHVTLEQLRDCVERLADLADGPA